MKSSTRRFLSLFLKVIITLIILLIVVPLLYYGFIYGRGYLKGVSVKITVTPEISPFTTQAAELPTQGPPPPAQPVKTIHLEPMLAGLESPTYLTHAYDDRLFVVEKSGRILVVQNWALLDPPFLDIRNLVGSEGSEQGLLSIAFHPAYPENGRFFINYKKQAGQTVIARYQVQTDKPKQEEPCTESNQNIIGQPYTVHK
jgi:glucose/arabinose dehydrogenase